MSSMRFLTYILAQSLLSLLLHPCAYPDGVYGRFHILVAAVLRWCNLMDSIFLSKSTSRPLSIIRSLMSKALLQTEGAFNNPMVIFAAASTGVNSAEEISHDLDLGRHILYSNRDFLTLRLSLWACPPGCLEQIKTARQDGSTTAPTFFRELNAFLIMLKFSDSYETYRICSQQYLHSIWIVFGCMGCWGWGGGAEPVKTDSRRTHVGLTSDQDCPVQTHLSVCNWILT